MSDGLSPDQVCRLYHGLRLKAAYFRTLTGRLHQTHCPRDDPLFVHANAAAEHMEKLFARGTGPEERREVVVKHTSGYRPQRHEQWSVRHAVLLPFVPCRCRRLLPRRGRL